MNAKLCAGAVVLVTAVCMGSILRGEDTPPPDPEKLTITHIVPYEGADKVDAFKIVTSEKPTVQIITTPAPEYIFVRLKEPPYEYGRLRPESSDPRVAWEIPVNAPNMVLAQAVIKPGTRAHAIFEGLYTPLIPGTGEPPKWTTQSISIDLDGDTNRDGDENLANANLDAKEDPDEDKAGNPGMIVPTIAAPKSSNILLRRILPYECPEGTVNISQVPTPYMDKDQADFNPPRGEVKTYPGGTVKLFRDAKGLQEVGPGDNLWDDVHANDLPLYLLGLTPGPVKLIVTYKATVGKTLIDVSDTINVTVVNAKILYTPKAVAADATGDVPIYFKLEGINQVFIKDVDVYFFAAEQKFPLVTYGKEFVVGDAVLLDHGREGANGSANDYTLLVPPSHFQPKELARSSATTSASYIIRVSFQDASGKGRRYTCLSEEQPIASFSDKTLEVVEFGENENIAPWKDSTRQKETATEEGSPVLMHVGQFNPVMEEGLTLPLYRNKDDGMQKEFAPYYQNAKLFWYDQDIGYGTQYYSLYTNQERSKYGSFFYTITSKITDGGANVTSRHRGEKWTSYFEGEKRGVYFTGYYGRKHIYAFDGEHFVVDVRFTKSQIIYNILPGSEYLLTLEGANLPDDSTTNVKLLDDPKVELGLAVLTLFVIPEPFTKLGYAISIANAFLALDKWMTTPIATTDTAAFARVYGMLTISSPTSYKKAIDFTDNLGGPGHSGYNTLDKPGSKPVKNADLRQTGTPYMEVFQTWIIQSVATVSTTATIQKSGGPITSTVSFTSTDGLTKSSQGIISWTPPTDRPSEGDPNQTNMGESKP